jgi:hypothetical protein
MAIVDMEEGDRERINKALAARKEYPARLAKKIKDHKEAIEDEGGLPTELNYYDFHKDAYNRREQRMLDEEISVAAMAVIGYQDDKKKKPNNFLLYGDEPGSMAVLED